MLARNPEGQVVEVTKKAFATLYRYRGWVLIEDEEGKAQTEVDEVLVTPKEVEEGEVDLAKLRKAELQELASEKGIEVKAEYTKDDLIGLLK